MSQIMNIYCDESCHLENDNHIAMVLGAVWCPKSKRLEISKRIRDIKQKHKLSRAFEIKWSKVSPSLLEFYDELIDFFFDDDDLHFRGVVIPNKNDLTHGHYDQTHDDFYYKMFFVLLKIIFDPTNEHRVYIDIKDTLGESRIKKLHDVLCNNSYDFSRKIITDVKRIHSHESEQLQIADLLIGALSYKFRHLHESTAKLALIEKIKQRSGYDLNKNTLYRENKFNLLVWDGRVI